MHRKDWYYALQGAAAYWVAALLFILIGGAFTAAGVWVEEIFLIIGLPFLCLGALVLILLIYSLYLKLGQPENYETWLWWVNFIGGLAGALTFAIPSALALPILLLAEMDDEALLIGAGFSVVGLAVTTGVWFVARKQYRERPIWVRKNKQTTAK